MQLVKSVETVEPRKVKQITELYRRIESRGTIHILGCAPNLIEDLDRVKVSGNDLVIALNASFQLNRHHIHFFADDKFLNLYDKELNKNCVAIHPNTIGDLGFKEEYTYSPSRTVRLSDESLRERNVSLSIGFSVSIPALHFACRLNPKQILMHGIDMNQCYHFDDKWHKTISRSRFPAARKVCIQMRTIVRCFRDIPIFCVNVHALPVKLRILKPLRRVNL